MAQISTFSNWWFSSCCPSYHHLPRFSLRRRKASYLAGWWNFRQKIENRCESHMCAACWLLIAVAAISDAWLQFWYSILPYYSLSWEGSLKLSHFQRSGRATRTLETKFCKRIETIQFWQLGICFLVCDRLMTKMAFLYKKIAQDFNPDKVCY